MAVIGLLIAEVVVVVYDEEANPMVHGSMEIAAVAMRAIADFMIADCIR